MAFFTLAFALGTATAGIATTLPVWASLLIMTGFVLAVTATLALLARRIFREGLPPAPEQAIEEARLTARALTANGDHSTH
jgi:heme A synthase